MFKHTLICLLSSHFFLSNLSHVFGQKWELTQDLFDKIEAACEDKELLNPDHSSRLILPSDGKPNSISQYPMPRTYAGWKSPSPFPQPSRSDYPAHGSDSTTTSFHRLTEQLTQSRFAPILDRLADFKVSPAERLADYGKVHALWGENIPAYRMKDVKWKSYRLFEDLWKVEQGSAQISNNLKRIIFNYLSRNRAEPLDIRVVKGLEDVLRSGDEFEKRLALNLQTHILREDFESKELPRPNPESEIAYEVNYKIHKYWTFSQLQGSAYFREVLKHLRDFSTPLWDRINAFDELTSRVERVYPAFSSDLSQRPTFSDLIAAMRFERIRKDEDLRIMRHLKVARALAHSNELMDDPVRKLAQQFFTLDGSQVDAIIKMRQAIEKISKDSTLNYQQSILVHMIQQVFLGEHFPGEETAQREAMTKELKNPELYNGQDRYSKLVRKFLKHDYYDNLDHSYFDEDKYVELLNEADVDQVSFTRKKISLGNLRKIFNPSSSSKDKRPDDQNMSSTRSENLLKIIRHASKYDPRNRFHIRKKLLTAAIISNGRESPI